MDETLPIWEHTPQELQAYALPILGPYCNVSEYRVVEFSRRLDRLEKWARERIGCWDGR
jgi:hypothetical protein